MAREALPVRQLFPEINEISDTDLADRVVRVWDRLWQEGNWDDIHDLPVAPAIPRPHLEHAQAVLTAAVAVSEIFERAHGVKFDKDMLIAGAVLQDVSKLVEYEPVTGGPPYSAQLSELGRDLQHAVYAAHAALDEGVPVRLAHMILAHSPQSAMAPKTKEVKLLHHIDQADVAWVHDRDVFKRTVMEHLG